MKACRDCRITKYIYYGDDVEHGWKMQLKKAKENNHPNCAFAALGFPRELRFACELGLKDTVIDMLDKGHSFDAQEHKTSLHSFPCVTIAACKGHRDIVELLLKRGAKVDNITFIAMATHQWMELFNTYAPKMSKEILDETLLKICMRIRSHTLEIMETLVKLGATVTTDVLLRLRKCFMSCYQREIEPLKQFIIRHIKHVNFDKLHDKDVVWPMLTIGQLEIATHILRHMPPKHPVRTKLLFRVAHSKKVYYTKHDYVDGYIECNQNFLDALIAKGANVNATNHKNQTPLGIACASQNWDVANRLLDFSAIPHSSGICKSCQNGITVPIDRVCNNPAGHHCPLWSPLLTSFLWVYKPDGKALETALRMCKSDNFDANVISEYGTIPYVYLYQHSLAPHGELRRIIRKKTKFNKDTLRTIAHHICYKICRYREFDCRKSIIMLMMHGVFPEYSFTRSGELVVDLVMRDVSRYGCYYQKFYFAEKAIDKNMNMFNDYWILSIPNNQEKIPPEGFLGELDTLFVLCCPVPLAEPRMNLSTI